MRRWAETYCKPGVHNTESSITLPGIQMTLGESVGMDERLIPTVALAGLGTYNVIQNRAIPPGWYVPANLAATWAMVALARRQGCTWEEIGVGRSSMGKGIAWGFGGIASAGVTMFMTERVPRIQPYLVDERTEGDSRSTHLYRTVVRFPLGTALFEEAAFRGALYAIWRKGGASHATATTAVSLAFGAWHLIPTADALEGNPLNDQVRRGGGRWGVILSGAATTAVASAGFGWLRRRSGSLIAPWLTHAALNSSMYLVSLRARRRAD